MTAIKRYRRLLSFGEVLLRLSSHRGELLSRARTVDVDVGGSEANVAVTLAGLGHECAMVSAVPDTALGDAAIATLRAAGVDCSPIRRTPGRMGLYWMETGAGSRASDVIYDREASAFSRLTVPDMDWPALLAGADRLHLSGITVALNAATSDLALAAAAQARVLDIPVSFDGNFRAKLWDARGGVAVPALQEVVACADIFLGNHRDINLLLGTHFTGADEADRRAAAEAAFAAFPNLRLIAATLRTTYDSNRYGISVRVDDVAQGYETDVVDIPSVVDRIGSGDAFASGILHAERLGSSLDDVAFQGLALCALKHTVHGDVGNLTQRHVRRFDPVGQDVVR